MRILLLLFPLLLLGCMSDPEPWPDIRPGLYEYSENFLYNGSFITIKDQAELRADHTYYREGFLNGIKFGEQKGNWKVDYPILTTTNILSRYLTETGNFGPWEAKAENLESIQSITPNSFQQLMQPGDIPAGAEGLVSGWKTWNRIGN